MINIIESFILPSGLIILFFSLGIVFFLFRKYRRFGMFLLLISILTYIVFGSGPISFWLLGNLEYKHPSLKNNERVENIKDLVVLSAYAEFRPEIPLTNRVNSASAFRLLETKRLFNLYPHLNIFITGHGYVPIVMKDLLISLGIPDRKIAIEKKSINTFENAQNVKERIGSESFLLVTSAGHMPRALKVFKNLNMNPIPAPTDYLTRKNYLAIHYLPSPIYLKYSDLALHEYFATLWYQLTGRI